MATTSRLPPPPLTTPLTGFGGITQRTWGNWFSNLYRALGGALGLGTYTVMGKIDDIHTNSSIYIGLPQSGRIREVVGCLQNTVIGVDEIINVYNKNGISMATITFPVTSTAGTVKAILPVDSSANTVSPLDFIKITSSGLSSSTCAAIFTVVVEYT